MLTAYANFCFGWNEHLGDRVSLRLQGGAVAQARTSVAKTSEIIGFLALVELISPLAVRLCDDQRWEVAGPVKRTEIAS